MGNVDPEALNVVAGSQDARLAWLVSDLLRFYQGGIEERQLLDAFAAQRFGWLVRREKKA